MEFNAVKPYHTHDKGGSARSDYIYYSPVEADSFEGLPPAYNLLQKHPLKQECDLWKNILKRKYGGAIMTYKTDLRQLRQKFARKK